MTKAEITVTREKVTVRDYGRGIPLGKVIDCVSQINTEESTIQKPSKNRWV
ncbi:MAG: hypothetical protein U0T32_01260 [Chitinophagales bacterium]